MFENKNNELSLSSSVPKMDTSNDDWISPDLFNSILEGYTNEEGAVQKALDKLFEPTDLEHPQFEQDADLIEKAIQDNIQLRQQIEHMIGVIDQQLQQNGELMKEAIQLSLVENRFTLPLRKTTVINKEYDKVSFFDTGDLLDANEVDTAHDFVEEDEQSELESDEEVDEEEAKDKADNELTLQQKAWSRFERDRLCEAIRVEAQRMMQLDFVKKNEEWRVWEVDKMPNKQLEEFPVHLFDWKRISTHYVRTRSPKECLIQWTIQEHPSINKKPWTKKESSQLSQLVDEIGLFSGQWERIASELGTNRTIAQCFSHYMFETNNKAAKSLKWSAEEDKKLKDAVKIYGNCNWQYVASIMKGRTGQQCLHRWTKSVNPAIKRQWWTEDEDVLLKRAVHLYGVGNWRKIQRLVPGRTDMQCRERWMNILAPTVTPSDLNDEDTERLISLVEQHGRTWSAFAKLFEGQTDNRLMRHYDKIMRIRKRGGGKVKRRQTKKVVVVSSEDDEPLPAKKKKKVSGSPKKTTKKANPIVDPLPPREKRPRRCKDTN